MSRSDEPGGGAVSTGPAGACSADAAGSGGMSAPWPDTLEARVARLLGEGESVVLVTVISRTGSAPRDAGTRALYTQAGPEGTVGGGLLEARAMEAAAQSLFMGRSARVSCDLSGFTPDSDMICGGGMEVLCEVLLPEQAGLFSLAALALCKGVGRCVGGGREPRNALAQPMSQTACPRAESWPPARAVTRQQHESCPPGAGAGPDC